MHDCVWKCHKSLFINDVHSFFQTSTLPFNFEKQVGIVSFRIFSERGLVLSLMSSLRQFPKIPHRAQLRCLRENCVSDQLFHRVSYRTFRRWCLCFLQCCTVKIQLDILLQRILLAVWLDTHIDKNRFYEVNKI